MNIIYPAERGFPIHKVDFKIEKTYGRGSEFCSIFCQTGNVICPSNVCSRRHKHKVSPQGEKSPWGPAATRRTYLINKPALELSSSAEFVRRRPTGRLFFIFSGPAHGSRRGIRSNTLNTSSACSTPHNNQRKLWQPVSFRPRDSTQCKNQQPQKHLQLG